METADWRPFPGTGDRTYRIITLLYYAYEGYRSCTEQLQHAIRNDDTETIRSIRKLQDEYRNAALKARRMLNS